MIADLRETGSPVFLVSAGDHYGTNDVFNAPKSRFVARMMAVLGYDAVGIGEMELAYGIDALGADVTGQGLPLVCANLMRLTEREPVGPDSDAGRAGVAAARTHGTVFPPYLVVEKGGYRLGIIGVVDPATIVVQRSGAREVGVTGVEAKRWELRDAAEAIAEVLPEVREKSDIVVLLAHMDPPSVGTLLARFPEVDIVVMGHDRTAAGSAQPGRVGNSYLLKATSQGQNIGTAWIATDDARRIANMQNRIHFLDNTYPDDRAMAARLDEFDAENREAQKRLYAEAQMGAARGTGAGTSPFLGVGACQQCHAEQFDVYAQTGHANAYRTLSADFVHRDTNCVGCHVTGYGEEGGFNGVRVRGTMLDLVDVQCEACHGPADSHSRDGRYRANAIASCAKCHTESEDPDFDFARDWEKIRH